MSCGPCDRLRYVGMEWAAFPFFRLQAGVPFGQGALRNVPLVAVRRLPLAARFDGAVISRQFSAGVRCVGGLTS